MCEENHKAIAEIIRKYRLMLNKEDYVNMINEFADYFEKEDREISGYSNGNPIYQQKNNFNRKQFLNWCGIEK